jgi:hypothetical protein
LLLVAAFVLTTISEALGGNIPLKWLQFVHWDIRDENQKLEMFPGKHAERSSQRTAEEDLLEKYSGQQLNP